jgi:hypothetical protein
VRIGRSCLDWVRGLPILGQHAGVTGEELGACDGYGIPGWGWWPIVAPPARVANAMGTYVPIASKPLEYRIYYDDGTVFVLPFSEPLAVGDEWKDSIARWRVIRVGSSVPGEPVEVWVEPVRD